MGGFGLAASALGAPGLTGLAGADGPGDSETGAIRLDVSGYPHEHIRGLATGKVRVKGCEISFRPGKIGDINTHVFSGPRTLGFTEIGLSPYIGAYADGGFRAYSLIPVFPLRVFRHKSIFVHADGGIEHPGRLKGKRVGTPGYSSTSLTWIRGIVQDEYGVRPEDIDWVISAADSSAGESGAISKQEQVLPEGLSISVGPPGKDESDLLLDGDVDALFHAAEPRAFVEGNPKIRRLFTDPRKTEQDYFAKTGIFPIMHAVAIRNDLAEEHPWLPRAVFEAYCEAKSLTYADMRAKWYLRTLPWFAQELAATESLMGRNFLPYGLGPNRKALDTLFRYMHEQGLAGRRLSVEEMFEPSTLELKDL
jgi:4,5-dihydroxyphthalate decarboxylase